MGTQTYRYDGITAFVNESFFQVPLANNPNIDSINLWRDDGPFSPSMDEIADLAEAMAAEFNRTPAGIGARERFSATVTRDTFNGRPQITITFADPKPKSSDVRAILERHLGGSGRRAEAEIGQEGGDEQQRQYAALDVDGALDGVTGGSVPDDEAPQHGTGVGPVTPGGGRVA